MSKQNKHKKIAIERERERVKSNRPKYRAFFAAIVVVLFLTVSFSVKAQNGDSFQLALLPPPPPLPPTPSFISKVFSPILKSAGKIKDGYISVGEEILSLIDLPSDNLSATVAITQGQHPFSLSFDVPPIQNILAQDGIPARSAGAIGQSEEIMSFLKSQLALLEEEVKKIEKSGLIFSASAPTANADKIKKEIAILANSAADLSAGKAGITKEYLEERLNSINTSLISQINNLSSQFSSQTSSVYRTISLTNKIDSLSGTSLSNITVSGVTGLTDADIPDGLTASNYLPLAGGTLTGALTGTALSLSGQLTVSGAGTSTLAGDTNFDSGTLYIDSINNRIGIASSSPSETLSVNGATYFSQISAPSVTTDRLYNASGDLYWNGNLIGSASVGNWTSLGGNVYRSSGNVGIGTTSPYAKLSVVGQTVSSYFTATSTIASTFPYASSTALTISGNSYLGTVASGLWNGTALTDAYISSAATWNNKWDMASSTIPVSKGGTGQTSFGQGWLNSDGTTITSSTSPTVAYLTATSTTATSTFSGGMNVAGTAGLTVLQNGKVGVGTTAPVNNLQIGNAVTVGGKLFLVSDGTTEAMVHAAGGLATYGSNTNHPTRFLVNAGEKVRIDTNGNVGIGTTSPYAKLSVVGETVAEYFTATSTTATSTFNGDINFGITSNILQGGQRFLTSSTTAAGNLTIGYQSATGLDANGGLYNTGVGYQALGNATSTDYNTALGYQALKGSATISNTGSNTAVGYQALLNNTTGYSNTAIGRNSLYSNTSGYQNMAFGSVALSANTTGRDNSAVGYGALYLNTTGSANIATGGLALRNNDTGSNNNANGYQSLYANTTGYYNTANGHSSLYSNTTGAGNVGLGYYSGYGDGTADQRSVIDNYATFIGYQASRSEAVASTSALTNITAIGKNARVGRSNSIVLGGAGADAVNVGIGTTSPYARLSVSGDIALDSLFVNFASSTAPSLTLNYLKSATSTIPSNTNYAWSIATSTTASPIFSISTLGSGANMNATTTINGGFNLDNGAILYDYSSGITTINALEAGPMNFADDAGMVTWFDLAITSSSPVNTPHSYTAQIDSNDILTIYSEADGSGMAKNLRVGIGTTTPLNSLTIHNATTTVDADFGFTATSTGLASFYNWTMGIDISDAGKFKIASSTALGTNDRFVINGGGSVGIGCADPDHIFEISGTGTGCNTGAGSYLNAAGDLAFTANSSREWKQNIATYGKADILSRIKNAPVRTFDWKPEYCPSGNCLDKLGFIAEEFYGVLERGDDKRINGQDVTMALWLGMQNFINVFDIASAATGTPALLIDALGNWKIGNDGALVVKEVRTEKLCVGSVCVTEEQFRTVFGNSQSSSSSGESSSSSSTSDVLPSQSSSSTSDVIPAASSSSSSSAGEASFSSESSASSQSSSEAFSSNSSEPESTSDVASASSASSSSVSSSVDSSSSAFASESSSESSSSSVSSESASSEASI